MSERSEFGPRAPPAEKRRAPDWRSQAGSRPATAVLVTFDKTKVTRATARKLLHLFFACLEKKAKGRSRAFARCAAEFLLTGQKEPKALSAGREPSRLRRAGPLRSLPLAARRPNSLRSDMGASTAATGCGARLALRLRESTAPATATTEATAGAPFFDRIISPITNHARPIAPLTTHHSGTATPGAHSPPPGSRPPARRSTRSAPRPAPARRRCVRSRDRPR